MSTPTTVEEVVRTELLRALGGWRGTLEAAVPILLFVVALAVGVVVMASIVVFLKSRDSRLAEIEAVAV